MSEIEQAVQSALDSIDKGHGPLVAADGAAERFGLHDRRDEVLEGVQEALEEDSR